MLFPRKWCNHDIIMPPGSLASLQGLGMLVATLVLIFCRLAGRWWLRASDIVWEGTWGNERGRKESGRPCITYHIEQMLNDLPVNTLICWFCWDARRWVSLVPKGVLEGQLWFQGLSSKWNATVAKHVPNGSKQHVPKHPNTQTPKWSWMCQAHPSPINSKNHLHNSSTNQHSPIIHLNHPES